MKKNLLLIAFTLSMLSGYSQTVQYAYLNDNATSFTTTFTASSGVIDRWMIYGKNSTLLDSVVVSTSTGAITYSRTPVIFSYTTALHSLTITNCIIVAFPPNSSYVHPYLDSLLVFPHNSSGSQLPGTLNRIVYFYPYVHILDSTKSASITSLNSQNLSLTQQLGRSRDSIYITPGYKYNYILKSDTIKTYSRDTTHYEPLVRNLSDSSKLITSLKDSLTNRNATITLLNIQLANKHDTIYKYDTTYIASSITSDTLKISIHTGISQTSPTLNSLKVYPNPSSTILHIDLEKQGYFTAKISGITVQTIITPTSGTIDVSGLANGIYILTIYDSNAKLISTNKISIAK